MKKILLPTDFSANAWNAIFTALKLYTDVKCKFFLLHAFEPKAMNMLGRKSQQRLGVIYDSLAQYSAQELDKILSYMNQNHPNPNHSFESISRSATLEESVLELVSVRDIDLVIMGTQGATGAKEIFMGSNTVKVLKQLKNISIIVVPSAFNFQKLKTLVFPTDYTRKHEKFELLPVMELSKLWNTAIQVIHLGEEFVLTDVQKTNMKILEERLAGSNYSLHKLGMETNIAKSIEQYVNDTRADLLAMVRYRHTFWEKIMGEPVIKKVAFHSMVPVLFLPEQA
ncbi:MULTISPECIES: universal stress protein [unclassified Arenibacter]|jgi:nucleotide-binding universal stress UspA family protein|uniref:universal stress protein n=1 Tax=unclassified Arenibacter TaxID=2615047 RepID=UPI000E34722A|nr:MULTISPECIES: universal stress protein [unclassified Arenibacter]MCM4163427.1 universal stress protein [Arenibacter sp. A80]RFT57426.1 universal stress protein [Arenibacter sp. P308M17]